MKIILVFLATAIALISCREENQHHKPIKLCGVQLVRVLREFCEFGKQPETNSIFEINQSKPPIITPFKSPVLLGNISRFGAVMSRIALLVVLEAEDKKDLLDAL
ncbi:hypothetical protein ACJJTC_002518 [Scirpophaga incertulas]